MDSVVLALDQSSRITGWSVFKNAELIASGKFELTNADVGQRLLAFRNKIIELINQYEINYFVWEDIQLQNSVSNNVATFKTLAEVYGICEEIAAELKLRHAAIFSSTWKSALGVKGKARAEQKRHAQEIVETMFNKHVSQDESDAICIGACASGLTNKQKDLPANNEMLDF